MAHARVGTVPVETTVIRVQMLDLLSKKLVAAHLATVPVGIIVWLVATLDMQYLNQDHAPVVIALAGSTA